MPEVDSCASSRRTLLPFPSTVQETVADAEPSRAGAAVERRGPRGVVQCSGGGGLALHPFFRLSAVTGHLLCHGPGAICCASDIGISNRRQ